MFVNARAIIERDTPAGTEIVVQTRNKPYEGGRSIELPGGRVEEFESLIDALQREVREETGLTLTHIEGSATRVYARASDTEVECLQPFAVYQTTRGSVDSMGVYFRCQGEGSLLEVGDNTLNPQLVPIDRIAQWMEQEPGQFGWIDRAGLLFYLKHRELLS
jgi:8-oxo-dGTP pyrophosphatase MutT (NUDIX family)